MQAQKALFMGRITAGATHEIKNVLAIIKESAGLIEDLISLGEKNGRIPTEKLLKTLTKITDQVNRGVELSTRLNEFAHTPDQDAAPVELNTAVERVVSLSQRFARLKRVRLEAHRKDVEHSVFTDPLTFLMLMFSGIELLMNHVGENGLVSVEPFPAQGDIAAISALPAETTRPMDDANAVMETEGFQRVRELGRTLNMSIRLEGPPLRLVIAEPVGS
ncbi:MAG: hypothetical protein ACP5M0_12555 [Desulfomonilaceae bacterium]